KHTSNAKSCDIGCQNVKSPRQRKPDNNDDSTILKPLNFQRVLPNQHQEKPKSQIVQLER
ncbi:hypothetical protein, partial [Vibrio cholerae]